jgi:hypothetical protein
MDRFILVTGIFSILLLSISLYLISSTIIKIIRKGESFKKILSTLLINIILLLISLSFLFLFLFLRTFAKFSYEEKIGEVYVTKENYEINVIFKDLKNNKNYVFELNGDQWMIEGEMIVFDKWLRWLGAESYYRVTRFSGRFEEPKDEIIKYYIINPKNSFWEFILKNHDKIPLIDTAYGIGAYQYPGGNYEIFINDTGFIIRKSKK